MHTILRRVTAATAAVTLLMLGSLWIAGSATAYVGSGSGGAPVWVPGDAARKGFVLLYDASGSQISGGSDVRALGRVGASLGWLGTSGAAPRPGTTSSSVVVAAPDPAVTAPAAFPSATVTTSSPVWSPAPSGAPSFTPNAPGAFVHLDAAGADLVGSSAALTLYGGADPDYLHVLEIRMADSGPGIPSDGTYWASDIEYNPPTATLPYDGLAPGAWRVVYPMVMLPTPSLTTPTVAPSAAEVVGTPLTFTTIVAPPTGSITGGRVRFFIDSFQIDGTRTISGTCTAALPCTVASGPVSTLAIGTYRVYAQYFTSAGVLVGSATSLPVTVTVSKPPALATITTLGLLTSSDPTDAPGTVTQPATLSGVAVVTLVAPGTPEDGNATLRGTVSFYAGGSTTPFAVDLDGSNGFGFTVPSAIFTGSPAPGAVQVITAVYAGSITSGAVDLLTSTSPTASVRVVTTYVALDVQAVATAIAPGTLTISTPYDGSPLKAARCTVGTDRADPLRLGLVAYTAVGAADHDAGASATTVSAGDLLPRWPGSDQQDTTECGFLFLPALTLNGQASLYSTTAVFDTISVTDTRPGLNPYTLNALSSPFVKLGVGSLGVDDVINAQNVGLTGLALVSATMLPPYNLFVGGRTPGTPGVPGVGSAAGENLTGYDNPAAVGLASSVGGNAGLGGSTGHQLLHAGRGLGTVTTRGLVTLNAPTTTRDGVYAGTITFTVLGS